MQSPFKDSRRAAAKARVPALSGSIFDSCPCCEKIPADPVIIAGTAVCRGCTTACPVCSNPCLPGDQVCQACLPHVGVQGRAA